jgi:hypothetical protein
MDEPRPRMKRIRVVKLNIPSGPICDWHDLNGSITDDNGEFAHTPEHKAALEAALTGLELGAQDSRILEWLAGWETQTVAVICSWINRARAQGVVEGNWEDGP